MGVLTTHGVDAVDTWWHYQVFDAEDRVIFERDVEADSELKALFRGIAMFATARVSREVLPLMARDAAVPIASRETQGDT
jgi:hypothetical protein